MTAMTKEEERELAKRLVAEIGCMAEGADHKLRFMEVSVFVQKLSQFEVKHIRLFAFRIQGNGSSAGLNGSGPFLPAFLLQNIQPRQLHGLFRT